MTTTVTIYSDETDPDTRLAWYDADGELRDLTTWTVAVEVVDRTTNQIVLDKSTGVTGGDGTAASNVNIAWTAADLTTLVADTIYLLRTVATFGAETAVFTVDNRGTLPAIKVLAAPTTP